VQPSGCRVAVRGIGRQSRRALSNSLAGLLVAKASTINGNMQRRTGRIQKELYAERLVWNKVRMLSPRASALDELARDEQQLIHLQDALSKASMLGILKQRKQSESPSRQ
jgi:hypothetical protein